MSFGKRHYVAAPYAQSEPQPAAPRVRPFNYGAALILAFLVTLPLALCTREEPADPSRYASCIASASTSADYSYCYRNFAGK